MGAAHRHLRRAGGGDQERRRIAGAGEALDQVEAARQAGFTHLGVTLSWGSVGELRDRLAWFSAAVIGG